MVGVGDRGGERITEHGRRLRKGDAVFREVSPGLFRLPFKVHGRILRGALPGAVDLFHLPLRGQPGEGLRAQPAVLSTKMSPSTSTSIFVLRKQSIASSGRQTTGSFSLKDVFSTSGTPVSASNARMSR